MIPDIALAASAREWPDRLHRFLLDHGGGRIVARVMNPEQATDEECDLLLIDDVCSFLTPRLVTVLKRSGVEVVGVFAPEDGSDAKRRLLECGISDVLETEATPEEFLEKIIQTLAHRSRVAAPQEATSTTLSIAVTGAATGVGITEVAIALAGSLSERIATALVDMDPVWPSVAQRLDLGLHPNIRTAIDHAVHSPDRLGDSIHELDSLRVVGGRADGRNGPPISRHESVALIEGLGSAVEVVVTDLGPVGQIEGGLIREFDSVIVVGSPNPVGIARLIKTISDLVGAHPSLSILAIVNMVGRSGFHRAETIAELEHTFPDLPVLTLPFDRRLVGAAWDGKLDSGKPYARAVGAMADVVVRSLG